MPAVKKTCRLVKISEWTLVLSIALIVSYILLMAVGKVNDEILTLTVIFAVFLFAASSIISIAALIKIYKGGEKENGKETAIGIIIAVCLVIFILTPTLAPMQKLPSRVVCGTQLSSLGKAILLYANEHNDSLPDPNRWCDLLIKYADALPKVCICPDSDAVEGESSYALNRNATGKKIDELPGDLVLLFDTNLGNTEGKRNFSIQKRDFFSHLDSKIQKRLKSKKVYETRWNQVGGPQILSIDNHRIGCNILFADGHVRYIDSNQISELMWKIEGKESFPEFRPKPISHQGRALPTEYYALLSLLILTISGLVVKFSITRHRLFAFTLGIITTGLIMMILGFLIVAFTEQRFHSYKLQNDILYAGAIAGFITGIGLGAVVSRTPEDKRKEKSFTGYITSVGMAAGVICWLIIQITNIAVKHAFEPLYFFWTLPLGIATGAIIGFLTSLVLRLPQNKKNES